MAQPNDTTNEPLQNVTGELEAFEREAAPVERPKRLLGGILLLVLPVVILIVGAWFFFGGKADAGRRPVTEEPSKPGDPAAGQSPGAASEEMAEALRLVRSTPPAGDPAKPTTPPVAGVGVATGPPPVTIVQPPAETPSAPVQPAPRDIPPQVAPVSQSGSFRSVVFEEAISKAPPSSPPAQPVLPAPVLNPAKSAPLLRFGSLLPVRLLGTVFTLRDNATVRLGLMRDVTTSSGTVPAGTELVGRVNGSAEKRVFIQVEGYLRPDGTLVAFGGEALGADGADGLSGKRRDVSSRWKRVFGTIGRAAFSLGRAYLQSRGSGAVIIGDVADSAAPEFQLRTEIQTFIELPAGTVGFVRVSSLGTPVPETRIPENDLTPVPGPTLTEAQLADLLERGTEADLRAALPKLPTAMRPLVEIFLTQAVVKGGGR